MDEDSHMIQNVGRSLYGCETWNTTDYNGMTIRCIL